MRPRATRQLQLALNSALHFLIDGVCAAAIFGEISKMADVAAFAEWVLLYNFLAFATQGLVGIVTDQFLSRHGIFRHLIFLSALSVSLGLFLPAPALVKILLLGLGNSLFHVSGGTVTLLGSEGKAAPLGIFVAPGALGLAVGTAFPTSGSWLAALLLLLGAGSYLFRPIAPAEVAAGSAAIPKRPSLRRGLAVAGMMLFCIGARSFAGTVVRFDWKTGVGWVILLAALVMLGKAAGGILADRFGCARVCAVSIPFSAICVLLFQSNAALSLLGQFLLNCSMPITLFLLYRALPDNPGFSFGLAASILLPGFLLGQMGQAAAVGSTLLTITISIIFALNLLCLILSERILAKKEASQCPPCAPCSP